MCLIYGHNLYILTWFLQRSCFGQTIILTWDIFIYSIQFWTKYLSLDLSVFVCKVQSRCRKL